MPIAGLYGLGVNLRHLLYDEGVFSSYKPSLPTICVGNLAVGGTGKTPMVEYLLNLLSPKYKVAVLSRGYKRKTKGLVVADAHSTAETIGDEAMQFHLHFPDVTVVVCEDRVKALKWLEQAEQKVDIVLLDDAFQHRAVRPMITILLTEYNSLYTNDHLLPWGKLRDLPHRATKVQFVVVTKCPDSIRPIDKRVVDNTLALADFQQLYFSRISYEPIDLPGTPLIVTAIAHTEYLIEHIRSSFPDAGVLTFPDHHYFTEKDIERIRKQAASYSAIVTTEKDLPRLQMCSLINNSDLPPVIVQPIRFTIDKETTCFDEQLLKILSSRK